MAFEPTKGFRNNVRALLPGDQILAVGTYLKDTLNLEKFFLYAGPSGRSTRAPVCTSCQKQMTSAGSGKGYKCRKCGSRIAQPEIVPIIRTILPGWYEVPPCARRHLAKPLIRDMRKGTKESLQGDTDF